MESARLVLSAPGVLECGVPSDNAHDPNMPAGYLCQISPRLSCAACCGLYNLKEPSRPALMQIVAERTRLFAATARDVDAIVSFKTDEEARVAPQLRFAGFYHCPFVGLIGPQKATVGCMLHPLAVGNQAIDYRSLSHYGALACGLYFCPATRHLTPTVKTILKTGAVDWYVYGLLVSEYRLLTSVFDELANRHGIHLTGLEKRSPPQAATVVKILENLKLNWPYRAHNDRVVCHYLFEDGLYTRTPVAYPGPQPSPAHDRIFVELASVFNSPADQVAAEHLITLTIADLAESVSNP